MTGKIFINYRRGDDAGFTQALYLRLEDDFASDDLFMDVEGHIKPGDDFVEVLAAQVATADVLLVVIGPRWVDLLASRQNDPYDFVTLEIQAALDQGIRVIPVLVGGAAMPRAELLPESIRLLARRNAIGLRPERFKTDCQGLVTALRESLVAAEQERTARTVVERSAIENARLEAEQQAASRTRATEDRGRAHAEAGLSEEMVRKAEELASWDFIRERNSVADLRDHLARFPGGTTERYALTKLDVLLWDALGPVPTLEQLRAYLHEFPKGPNARAAQSRVTALEQEAAKARAAEERRDQETADWAATATSTDETAIRAFLKRWPAGQHLAAASARQQELKRGSVVRRGMILGLAASAVLVAIVAILVGVIGYAQVTMIIFPSR